MTVAQVTGTDDRRLLAEVSKWAHANGWTNGGWRGYMNGRYWHEATVMVRPNECGFDVFRVEQAGAVAGRPDEYPATSVREAVDLLVALRILPVRFSSAFEAGVDSQQPTIRRLIHGLVYGSAEQFVRLREQVGNPAVSIRSGDAVAAAGAGVYLTASSATHAEAVVDCNVVGCDHKSGTCEVVRCATCNEPYDGTEPPARHIARAHQHLGR